MMFHLSPALTIDELQRLFQQEFPYLKLEFFTRHHQAYQGSSAHCRVLDTAARLGTLAGNFPNTDILVQSTTSVKHLEQLFENECGLHVQMFRKSGPVWLQTSATDGLTLAHQNAKGWAADQPQDDLAEMPDYREQD